MSKKAVSIRAENPRMRLAIPIASARAAYRRGWRRGWSTPKRLNVSEWADTHRILPRETSKEPGPWRTDRNPPARAIMDSLSPHSGAQIVTVCAGTQTVKTETGNNFVGYIISHDPGTVIVCQPTGMLGRGWRRTRFDPMAALTQEVGSRIASRRSRDSDNTLDMVRFPGGWLIIAQSESAASLSMYSARYLFLDEVDSYPLDTGGEGDPVLTIRKRTDNFTNTRKILQVSSPKKIMGASIIWREYLTGDQRQYHVPCPHCGTMQILTDEQILPTGEYLCEHGDCGRPIPHSAKTDMLAEGEWRAKFPERTWHHSYRHPSVYSPVGLGCTWKALYEEREAAKDKPKEMKVFVTTRRAVPYESIEGKVEPEELKACREDWSMREIPKGCLLLGCATDVQGNRVEAQILGFGPRESDGQIQIFVVDYVVIPGSPVDEKTYQALDDYLSRALTNSYGVDMMPRFNAIDSGHWTQEVYRACFARRGKGWIAVKGSSTANAALVGPPKKHSFNWNGRYLRDGDVHHMIGTNVAKDTILERLALIPKQPTAERWWRLPKDLPDAWFEQICNERRDPETGAWEPVKSNARQEPIDVSVYAWAAAHIPHRMRLGQLRARDWQHIRDEVEPVTGDLFAQTTSQVPRAPSRPVRRRPASGVGFGSDEWAL